MAGDRVRIKALASASAIANCFKVWFAFSKKPTARGVCPEEREDAAPVLQPMATFLKSRIEFLE